MVSQQAFGWEFLPPLQLGWHNGWSPILAFYLLFRLLLSAWPKEFVKKLFAVSGWSRTERMLSLTGKPFALTCLGLVFFSPLKLGDSVFWIGASVFLIGFLVMFVALHNARSTPVDQVVEKVI